MDLLCHTMVNDDGLIYCSMLCSHCGHRDTFFRWSDRRTRICIWAKSMSHCLLMAPWLDLLFTSAMSTTYQEQNMSMWWSRTFHLIIFSHTDSSQQLLTLRRIGYVRKRLQCSMPQMIFTATNQPNWFHKTCKHWNACQQSMLMQSPPTLHITCNSVKFI